MPTVLITGASRGLGLEFSRQYAADGWRVYATCRRLEASAELRETLGDVQVREMDISDSRQVAAVAEELRDLPIDILLNNAGIVGPQDGSASFGGINLTSWQNVMEVNAMAPVKVTEAFLGHVQASERKTIVFVSSRAGSIAERGTLLHHKPGGSYIFRSSKAALNAAAKSLAFDLEPLGVGVLVLHPGWVRTDAGGPHAHIDPETSVFHMRRLIMDFSPSTSEMFLNYDGQVIPW